MYQEIGAWPITFKPENSLLPNSERSFNLQEFDSLMAKHEGQDGPQGYGTDRSVFFRVILGGAAVLILSATILLFLLGAAPETAETEAMTYKGMNLDQFAVFMELQVDNPYTVALFEELCETEEFQDLSPYLSQI